MEYCEILDKADECEDPYMCLLHGIYRSTSTYQLTWKPFSPILGETYEMVNHQGVTFITEQALNYKTQQSRLFSLLASAYVYIFVGQWLNWLYTDVTQKLEAKDFSTLLEAHACRLKSVTTSATYDAFEECRKLCGGHGYLNSSGLPDLFAVYVPACTYEGGNVFCFCRSQDVARFVMKTVPQLASGKTPVGTTA